MHMPADNVHEGAFIHLAWVEILAPSPVPLSIYFGPGSRRHSLTTGNSSSAAEIDTNLPQQTRSAR